MITIFRKEMRKWHFVLWAVFASMAVSGVSLVFWRSQGGEDAVVATVDSQEVTAKDFKNAVQQLQRQYAMISSMYGISLDVLLKTFLGGQDLQAIALDNAIKNRITEHVENDLDVVVGSSFFKEELAKNLPQGIADAQGRVNAELYENYLQRLSMTPAEFEAAKEAEFRKEAVDYVIGAAAYSPRFVAQFKAQQEAAHKTFVVLKLDQAHFKANASDITAEEVKRFYDDHKEKYRVAERKQARIARLSSKSYEEKIVVDEQAIQTFYEKNKASKYRIPPKIKVRHISFNGHEDAVKAKAEDVLAKIRKNSAVFADLAKQYSQDKDSAAKGGITEYFSRGTFGAAFEKEAFKLMKNGDVAPLVRSEKGYEIIMLDERINASEKPLKDVREEILSALRTRKAGNNLKSDLESLVHSAKNNPEALNRFIAEKSLQAVTTDLLAGDDRKEDGFDGKLVDRLFSKSGGKGFGYFMHKDDYIIYQIVATEKAFLQQLSEVEKQVAADCAAQKTVDALKHFAKTAKSDVLEGKRDLASYKADGFVVVDTGDLKRGDSVSQLKDVAGLVDRAFLLDDKAQVLEYRVKNDIYLIQLVNSEIDSSVQKISPEKTRGSHEGRVLVHGFIASLQRNAKITVNETLINTYKSL